MRVTRRLLGALSLLALLGAALTATLGVPLAYAAGACTELIVDGGFETGTAWQLGQTPLPPQYENYARHSGNYALALGITDGGNVQSYSSARQTVTIPAGATQATLSFWVYPMAEGAATTDYMELVLLSADGSAVLDKPWYSHNDSRTWNQLTFDLTRWRGWTLQVYFNVYNDGLGGTAGMFLDDVSLLACPGGSPITPPSTSCPGPASTPCPPPTATSCPLPAVTSCPPLTATSCPLATSMPCPPPTATSGPPATASPTRSPCALLLPCKTPIGPADTPLPSSTTPTSTSRPPTATPMPTCPPKLGVSCSSWSAAQDPPASALAGLPAITPEVTTLALVVTSRPLPTPAAARTLSAAVQATRTVQPRTAGGVTERWPITPGAVVLIGGGLLVFVVSLGMIFRKRTGT